MGKEQAGPAIPGEFIARRPYGAYALFRYIPPLFPHRYISKSRTTVAGLAMFLYLNLLQPCLYIFKYLHILLANDRAHLFLRFFPQRDRFG